MRPSRLVSLIWQLPSDSRLVRALDPSAEWSTTEHLLAAVVDALHTANWQRGGGKGSRPEPIERPGQRRADVIETDAFDSLDDFMTWRQEQLDND